MTYPCSLKSQAYDEMQPSFPLDSAETRQMKTTSKKRPFKTPLKCAQEHPSTNSNPLMAYPFPRGGGGVGTRPWWLALLACGGADWPLALEPSAMTSRHPYYCGHPPAWVGIQNATSAHGGGGVRTEFR